MTLSPVADATEGDLWPGFDARIVRTAREVLNELKWREGRDLAKASVWVRGRTANDVKAIGGDEITELGRRYFSTATATIPYYKVVRIEYGGEVLFERPPPPSGNP